MSTQTRWECYECNGKATQSKRVEKVQPRAERVQPDDRSFLKRMFRPTPTPPPPPPPEIVWVQEKCSRCGGTGVLMLSLEEVQRLEDQHQEERRRQIDRLGLATGPKILVIDPIDQPIRPPRPDLNRDRTYRCGKCGFTAGQGFPSRRNTLVGGDREAYELYCPKCGQRDPTDITTTPKKRTVNWDSFGKPRGDLKPGSGL
jgi:predicted RNA-binding Zn-ribbon protein involved in translation (DUF1610 family)